MATRKKSVDEDTLMTPANISKVIRLLEPTEEGVKPITKKDACQYLGMSYNTTRLGTIIEDFKKSPLSLMPENLETLVSPQELADLFAYLSLDRPPGDPKAKLLPGAPEPRKRSAKPASN